nr:hypothetical protein [Tanacetum cinerariifolium]
MDQDRHIVMVEDTVGNQFRPNAVQNVTNQIAQEEEAWIQSTQEELEFMAAADAYEETERVKANCTLENNLQQVSTYGTQSGKALVYDSDGSAEVNLSKNCYENDMFNMFTQKEQYTELLEPILVPHPVQQNDSNVTFAVSSVEQVQKYEEWKYDKFSYDKAYNDMQQKIKRLQAQLGDLKGKSKDTLCVSTTLDPLSQKLENENVELEFQNLGKDEGASFAFDLHVPRRYFQHDLISYLKLKRFSSYVGIALLTITGGLDTALDLNYFLSFLMDDLWASELSISNLSPSDRQEMSRLSETINDYPNRVLPSRRLW